MAIDTSGEWWTGTDAADIKEYLQELEPGGYPVHRAIAAVCPCGYAVFDVDVDQDDELGRVSCRACGRRLFIMDSGEHWSAASPRRIRCGRCDAGHEVALGLCIHVDDSQNEQWVRWMSVGLRCTGCGVLSSPLDWKSDSSIDEIVADVLRP